MFKNKKPLKIKKIVTAFRFLMAVSGLINCFILAPVLYYKAIESPVYFLISTIFGALIIMFIVTRMAAFFRFKSLIKKSYSFELKGKDLIQKIKKDVINIFKYKGNSLTASLGTGKSYYVKMITWYCFWRHGTAALFTNIWWESTKINKMMKNQYSFHHYGLSIDIANNNLSRFLNFFVAVIDKIFSLALLTIYTVVAFSFKNSTITIIDEPERKTSGMSISWLNKIFSSNKVFLIMKSSILDHEDKYIQHEIKLPQYRLSCINLRYFQSSCFNYQNFVKDNLKECQKLINDTQLINLIINKQKVLRAFHLHTIDFLKKTERKIQENDSEVIDFLIFDKHETQKSKAKKYQDWKKASIYYGNNLCIKDYPEIIFLEKYDFKKINFVFKNKISKIDMIDHQQLKRIKQDIVKPKFDKYHNPILKALWDVLIQHLLQDQEDAKIKNIIDKVWFVKSHQDWKKLFLYLNFYLKKSKSLDIKNEIVALKCLVNATILMIEFLFNHKQVNNFVIDLKILNTCQQKLKTIFKNVEQKINNHVFKIIVRSLFYKYVKTSNQILPQSFTYKFMENALLVPKYQFTLCDILKNKTLVAKLSASNIDQIVTKINQMNNEAKFYTLIKFKGPKSIQQAQKLKKIMSKIKWQDQDDHVIKQNIKILSKCLKLK